MDKYEQKYHPLQYKRYLDFEKALYLPTKQEQLDEVKRILKDPNSHDPINGNYGTLCGSDELPESFLYGEIISCKKWELEIEIYIENLIEESKKQGENEINHLIEERYKNHLNVLSDTKENEHFKHEVSSYITDRITEYIHELRKDVNRSEIDNNTPNKLTQKQIALLFHTLNEKGIFNKKKIHQDDTKQVEFLAKLFNIHINTKTSNHDLYKYWLSIQKETDPQKVNTEPNKKAIEPFLKLIDLQDLE